MGVMSRAIVRQLGGHYGQKSRPPGYPTHWFSTMAQDVGVERKGRGGAAGVAAVLVAASVVGGTYYAMTMEPQPRPTPPVVPMQSMPKPSAPTEIVSPFAPPKVSARDELTQRLDALRTELETLRKQKKDKLVDMKKKAIKEEIHTIQSGLAALDKR